MKKYLFLLLIAALTFNVSIAQESEYVQGELIIQLTDNDLIDDVVNDLSALQDLPTGISVIECLSSHMRAWHIKFDPSAFSAEYIKRKVGEHPNVSISQFNHLVEKRETPNDPDFGNQWQHVDGDDHDIDSDLAWDITTGGTTAFGDEIVVCVIEGGNLMHEDLQDNRWVNTNEIPDNGIDDDENGYVDDYDGWNVNSNSDDGVFNGGHGTQVFGMIGAKGDNDMGVVGANWNVKLMSVAGESAGNEASVIEAYDYPLTMRKLYASSGGTKGAFVVATNASWGIDNGDPNTVPLWCQFYDTLGTYGILNCGATANNNVNIDVVGDIPTACPSDYMISVTATNDNDARTFSAYGQTTIDLGAPGEAVWTTQGSNAYGSTSGTSFASPITAGAIALIYSTPCPSFMSLVHGDPQAGADYVRQVLFDGVDAVDQLETESVTGGRLNVNNSIQIVLNTCSDSDCLVPFAVDVTATGDDDYQASWGSIPSMLFFDVRYKKTFETDWNESFGITENTFDMPDLDWCSEYEFQVRANCEEEEISDWSNSVVWESNGCCEAPESSSITITGISETGATINWQNILPADSYTLILTDADGVNTVFGDLTVNMLDLTDLTPCASYSISIDVLCEGDMIFPGMQEISFSTFGCGACSDLTFCDAEGGTEEEFIQEVSFADMTNSSGNNNGYGDFTGMAEFIPTVGLGGSYPIEMTPGYSGQEWDEYFIVWMDFNQNGEFEDSEIVFESPEAGSVTVGGDVTIPNTAAEGSCRLRVSMQWLEPAAACGEYQYGEVEDYCIEISGEINVDEEAEASFDVYPNPSNGLITITPQGLLNIEVVDITGRTVLSQSINRKVDLDLSAEAEGTYLVRAISSTGAVQTKRIVLIK